MAIVCAVTAVASLLVLVSQRFLRLEEWAAAVAFPAALTYAIPFEAALAVSGLMVRRAALVVAAAVACSALVATVGSPFLETVLPFRDAALAVGAAGVVAVARLVSRRSPVRDEV